MHRNRPSIHTQARIIVAQLGDSLWRTVRVRGRKIRGLSFAAIGLQYREEPGRSKWYVVSERGGYGLSPTAVRRRRGAYPTREKLNCER